MHEKVCTDPLVKISVILPTYNEAGNIEPLVRDLLSQLDGYDTEILIVDDDSPDETWRVAGEAVWPSDGVKVIRRMANRGLVASISHGIECATGDIVCWMDADFSMPPETLPSLLRAVERGADLAIGSRYVAGGSDNRHNVSLQRFLSRVLTFAASRILNPGFRDYTSGFIAIRRRILLSLLPLEGDYGEYFIALVYRAYRAEFNVEELPYSACLRRSGESKTATNWFGYFTRGWGYVCIIFRLRAMSSRQ